MLKTINNNTKNFFLGTFIIYTVIMGVFFTFAGIFLKEVGFLEGFVGKTLSYATLSIALSSVLSSFLIKNYGYKKIIISGIILIAVGMFGMISTITPALIIFSTILIGTGFSMHMTSEGAFLMENIPEKDRVQIFSYNFALKNVGIILGSLIGGKLSDILKYSFGNILSLKIMFLIFIITLIIFIYPITKITENNINEQKINFKNYLKIYKKVVKGRIIKFLIYNSTVGLGAGMVVPFFSVYLKYTLNVENTTVGIILSIAQLGCVVGGLSVPFLVKKLGREKTVMLCQMLSIPFLISIAFPQGIILITVSFLMRSTLMNLNQPIIQNLSMEMVEEGERPILSSLFALSSNFTRAIGIMSGGYLMEKVSYNSPYYFTIVLYLLGTYMFLKLFGRGKPLHLTSPLK